MMTLGTTGAFGFEDFHPPEVLGHYSRAGCKVVQVYRNRQREFTPKDIVSVVNSVPLRIDSLHGVFGDDLDPSSEDEAARGFAVETYRREADFCQQIGGDLVVVHPSPARVPVESLDRKYAQLRRSFDELGKIGERMHQTFAFENMPPYHPVGNDVARLVGEIVACGHPRIVFLLDTGHAHMTGGIVPAVRTAGANIKYTHVHDNDGQVDTHLMPLRGTLPWDDFGDALHEVAYGGVFLLEVFEKTSDLPTLLTDDWRARIAGILNGPVESTPT